MGSPAPLQTRVRIFLLNVSLSMAQNALDKCIVNVEIKELILELQEILNY